MNKIKIISNPYIKSIKFQKYDEEGQQWSDITEETNQDSELLKEDIITNFFPFKVTDILKNIVREFGDNDNQVEVVFEGTDDEYDELKICASTEKYKDVIIYSRSEDYIENARDVLPRIITVFKDIKELIGATEIDKTEIQYDLKKFSEASDDLIPLCVMGNYSSGKSTFINALIGNEILPNGDAPVTAKIYKITPSKDKDRAFIRFKYDDEDMELVFTNTGLLHDSINYKNDIMDLIIEDLKSVKGDNINIYSLVGCVLATLNEPINEDDEPLDEFVSDIIEIEIPFVDGILGNGKHRYAIFDTPGSNSASNSDHLQVLKKAMANMSNGLPIFVSEYKSLDSMDNENLYNMIKELKELDDRFTMIIVNKADEASLPQGELDRKTKVHIMRQMIPRKLYSGGIYFVSSIIGLGAKNDGHFLNMNYAEKFLEKKERFSNPNYEFYKSLYQYNIIPEYLRGRMLDSASSSKNLLLANSGLYSIEEEIENFASKYSAYDKCYQSELFLSRVEDQTEKEIDISKEDLEDYRSKLNDDLNEGEQRLINSLNTTHNALKDQFDAEKPVFNEDSYAGVTFNKQSLDKYYYEVTRNQQEKQNVSDYQSQFKNDNKTLVANLSDSFSKMWKEKDLSALSETADQFISDVGKSWNAFDKINEVNDSVDEEAGKDLVSQIMKIYISNLNTKQDEYDTTIKEYWEKSASLLKEQLTKIVKGDSLLSDEDKTKLIDLILTYDDINFTNKAEQIFNIDKFEYRLFGLKEFKFLNKLNTNKIANIYNEEIIHDLTELFNNVQNTHKSSFDTWANTLLNNIIENIVEFNPELKHTAKNIAKQTRKIDTLEETRRKLEDYMKEIQGMLEWKTFR